MRSRRAWALCGVVGVALVIILLALPVSVPTADDSGLPLPGMGTVAPPVSPASDSSLQPVGTLFGGQTATQEFIANGTRVRTIGLYLGTYKRANSGTATVTVQAYRASAWQDLRTQSFDKQSLRDNAYEFLSFTPAIPVLRGESLRIVLQVEAGSSQAITWWKNISWNPDGYALYLNAERQDGTARFIASYEPVTGRLVQELGPLWSGLTIFLNPAWRVVLLIGIAAIIASAVVALRLLAR